jgi:hypothetical protein
MEQQKIEKLQEMFKDALDDLQSSVIAANGRWDKTQSAREVSMHLEDIAVAQNKVTQMIGLLGYFEMVNEDSDPLES